MVIRTLALCCALAITSTTVAQESAGAVPSPAEEPAATDTNETAADTAPAAAPASPSPTPTPQPTAQPASRPAAQRVAAAPIATGSPLEEEEAPAAEDDDDEINNYGVMYVRLQGGLSFVNLLSFSQDNFIPEAEESSGVGPFGGLAVGFRVYWFSLGANATFGRQGGFDLGTVGAELAFHIPIPRVQPYIRLAAGYAWVGRYDFQNSDLTETDIFGLTIEAGAGIDIKLARHLSIGAGVDAAFLNLTRQEFGTTTVAEVDLAESGDALGFQLRAHAHLTIHI